MEAVTSEHYTDYSMEVTVPDASSTVPHARDSQQYQHVKFTFTCMHDWGSDCIQLSQISLFAADNLSNPLPIISAENPGGRSPYGQGCENASNGMQTHRKFLDFNIKSATKQSVLILHLKSPAELAKYDIFTADDYPSRDPTAWRLEASASARGPWVLLDERAGVSPPMGRYESYGGFVIGQPAANEKEPPPQDGLFTRPVLNRQTSVQLAEAWSHSKSQCPEYQKAMSMVVVKHELMSDTQLAHALEAIDATLTNELGDSFETILVAAIQKAYNLQSQQEAKRQRCILADYHLSKAILDLNDAFSREWRGRYFIGALRVLSRDEDASALIGLLSLLARAGSECRARKLMAFNTLILRARVCLCAAQAHSEAKLGSARAQQQQPPPPQQQQQQQQQQNPLSLKQADSNCIKLSHYMNDATCQTAAPSKSSACPCLPSQVASAASSPPSPSPSASSFSQKPPNQSISSTNQSTAFPSAQLAEIKQSAQSNTSAAMSRAARIVYECLLDYLDEHKIRAFKSAFVEPTKLLIDRMYDTVRRDDVEVHGSNAYATMLLACLGVRLPVFPYFREGSKACVVFLRAADKSAVFKRAFDTMMEPEHFGKDWLTLPAKILSEVRQEEPDPSMPPCGFIVYHEPECDCAASIANTLINSDASCTQYRQEMAKYLERFAHFFSEDFFPERAIVHLIGDDGRPCELQQVFEEMMQEEKREEEQTQQKDIEKKVVEKEEREQREVGQEMKQKEMGHQDNRAEQKAEQAKKQVPGSEKEKHNDMKEKVKGDVREWLYDVESGYVFNKKHAMKLLRYLRFVD